MFWGYLKEFLPSKMISPIETTDVKHFVKPNEDYKNLIKEME